MVYSISNFEYRYEIIIPITEKKLHAFRNNEFLLNNNFTSNLAITIKVIARLPVKKNYSIM